MRNLVTLFMFSLLVLGCGNDQEGLKLACEWARLAPLPAGVQELRIDTEGGAASREFIVSFKADAEVIEAWLKESPGVQDAEVEKKTGYTLYKIKPKDAQFAELQRFDDGRVRLRTYWS